MKYSYWDIKNTKIHETYYLDEINRSLDNKGWFFERNYLENEICDSISDLMLSKDKKGLFKRAKIGISKNRSEDISVRKGKIRWIVDWNENLAMKHYESVLSQILYSTSKYFYLSLKSFESQFAIYEKGDFYKCHLDQPKKDPRRQFSCCLYLTDCIQGGELILYKKGSKTEVDHILRPRKGSFVIFLSRQIFHEVKLVHDARYSISTWLRDDESLSFCGLPK